MRITHLDCFLVRLPYKPSSQRITSKEGAFNAARALHPTLDTLMIRVETEGGLVGWGEAFGHACNPASMALLTERVFPFFKGEHCEDIRALMEKAHYAFHSYGRGGNMMYALSALDIALWDIKAQAEQLPLWRLLGGQRTEIDIYPSLASYDGDVPQLIACIERLIAQGYRSIKLHERDPHAIAAVGRAMPNDVTLMVDTNCAWQEAEAHDILPMLHDAGIAFVEEPTFPPENLRRLKRLKQATGMRLAAGENLNNSEDFLLCMEQGWLDVMQPSVAKIGGISAVLDIIAAFDPTSGATILPHCFYYGPGLLASAHLVSILPQRVPLEVPWLDFETTLYPFMRYQPVMPLPSTPGLGFTPDITRLEAHLIARG